jgi:hypothetical protein
MSGKVHLIFIPLVALLFIQDKSSHPPRPKQMISAGKLSPHGWRRNLWRVAFPII